MSESNQYEVDEQKPAPKELQQQVRETVERIIEKNYDPYKCSKEILRIGDIYYDKKTRIYRKSIGGVLSEYGYANCTYELLKNIKKDKGYFPKGLTSLIKSSTSKTIYDIFNNAWNYSDANNDFCIDLANSSLAELLINNLEIYPNRNPKDDGKEYFVIKASLGIMCNMAQRPQNKATFQQYKPKLTDILQEFLDSENRHFQTVAIGTLSGIVNKEEAQIITKNPKIIENIIRWMSLAVDKTGVDRIKQGFTASSLCRALDKLAIDGNVECLIKARLLKVLYRMLQSPQIGQQITAAECICRLAFDDSGKAAIKADPELLKQLKSMKMNKHTVNSVTGALFNVYGKEILDDVATALKEISLAETPDDSKTLVKYDPEVLQKDFIFISYSWSQQPTVLAIREQLREKGYKVWIDVERMSGSILSAMADAVENSTLILMCVSESYKQSHNCQLEASYANKRKKTVIPLIMETRYDADGWLGLLIGTKLYFDFSSTETFPKTFTDMIKEVEKNIASAKSPSGYKSLPSNEKS